MNRPAGLRRLAAAAAVLALGLPAPASATATVTSTRFAGADRYGTAEAIATGTFTDLAVAVVATGENYPDALAASYLTGANRGPVLLTPTSAAPQHLIDTLRALKTEGVQVVGGTVAVSAGVVDQLRASGFEVDRIAGADRYATARAIAETLPAAGIGELAGNGRTAIVASGENFPDALAAGPVSHALGFPLLLTPRVQLSADASAAMDRLGIRQVLLMGGTAAVDAAVEAAIAGKGITVRRVAGNNRQQTAAALADLAVAELKWAATHVDLARGDLFPDALAGGPHGGQELAPILLTDAPDSLGAPARDWLAARAATVSSIHVYGGPQAVSDATLAAARQAAGGS